MNVKLFDVFFLCTQKLYLCKFFNAYKNLNQRVSHTTPIYINM